MPTFRKRPVEVEAFRFFPETYEADSEGPGVCLDASSSTGFSIGTLEGEYEVTPGDWIITGVKGERYPCKHDIFIATYDPVDSAEEIPEFFDDVYDRVRFGKILGA